MKHIFTALALATSGMLLSGCGGSSSTDSGTTISFKAVAGDQAIGCGQTITGLGTGSSSETGVGTDAKIANFRMFVHDINLITDGGIKIPFILDESQPSQNADVALLDFRDTALVNDAGTEICPQDSEGTKANPNYNDAIKGTFDIDPAYTIRSIQFTLGVPFDLNHKDPAAAEEPLRNPGLASGMTWGWQGGYKFLGFDVMPVGGITRDGVFLGNKWNIHLGSTGCEVDPTDGSEPTECVAPNRPTIIEKQISIPLFGEDPIEHGLNEANSEQTLRSIQADPIYSELFANAFPDQEEALLGDLAWDNVIKSLASFVRGLVSFDSPYDNGQLTVSAKRGEALFNGERLECFHCHTGYNLSDATIDRGTSFSELDFHNTGLYNIDGLGAYPDPNTGRHEVTGKPEHMGQFRAQSLRNVALSAPYNHDGSVATLRDVILNYSRGGRLITSGENSGDGRISPLKDGFIVSFEISDDEVNDVVSFLESLTDTSFVTNPRFSNPWLEDSEINNN